MKGYGAHVRTIRDFGDTQRKHTPHLTTQILKEIWKLEKDEDVTLRNLIDLRKTVGGYQRLSDWSSISVARKRNLWSGSVVNTGSTVASFELTL